MPDKTGRAVRHHWASSSRSSRSLPLAGTGRMRRGGDAASSTVPGWQQCPATSLGRRQDSRQRTGSF
jgi:hypothetical protein